MARLAHELTLSPRHQRLRQIAGIGRALQLIESAQEYPYTFICFQITGYRPRRTEDALLDGKSLTADLAVMADALTAASPLPVAAAQGRLYDAEVLAKRFSVSTKTISRWRTRGLAGCWYAENGDKPRFAFAARAVERFVARHRNMVRRGGMFQLMGEEERARIIDRARELVASEKIGLHEVNKRLAEESGRAIETVRYTLRRFDRDHPNEALFDRVEQGRELDEGSVILRAYSGGDSVADLAARFGKTKPEIRRTLTATRAKQLAADPISYIYNESFDAPDAEETILASQAPPAGGIAGVDDVTLTRVPAGLPPYLRDLYRTPLLRPEEERCLFRRMNYLLHKADVLRQGLEPDPASATPADVAGIDDLLAQATEIKNRIIQANLRLVVSIAKRHLHVNRSADLFELVSDGNMTLMRAVEKFDYARGFRFSTYGSWAIKRSYARTVPEEMHHIGRFQTGQEELLSSARDHRMAEDSTEAAEKQIRSALAGSLAVLEDRERSIVERHYGLANGGGPQTLETIGRAIGLSKERVRQIEMRALQKLRGCLGEHGAELLAG